MEKIFIKPTSQEILVKGSKKEGHLDIYSYDYEDDDTKRKLGSLYLIGNVQQGIGSTDSEESSDIDANYITNLVASLAKREYYSDQNLSPKEAFSCALKKINDVIDEFFVNKNIKINIGIFALAGENIHISKLGKFKILLARDGKNIDILNNIDLFTKERVEEKEFSHVVSGRIGSGDKILAFYPGRLVTAREKTLKESFLKLGTDQFVQKINSIKNEKNDFACAALYISLNQVKEPALAKKTRHAEPKPMIDLPPAIFEPQPSTNIVMPENEPQLAAETKSAKTATPALEVPKTEVELPRIIRSEFALGKKDNPVMMVFNKMRFMLPQRNSKAIFFGSAVALILIGGFVFKSLFVLSPEEKKTANAVSEARDNLRLAKTKIDQNDLITARKLLMGSIGSIAAVTPSKKTDETKSEILQLLDNLDQASEASPVLVEALPRVLADRAALLSNQKSRQNAVGVDVYEDNLYILKSDTITKIADVSKSSSTQAKAWLKTGIVSPGPLFIAVDGKVYVLNKSGLLTTYYKGEKEKEINTLVLPDDSSVFATTKDSKYLYLINKALGRIYLISKESSTLSKTLKVSSQAAFTQAYLDQDESVYLVSQDSKVWQIK